MTLLACIIPNKGWDKFDPLPGLCRSKGKQLRSVCKKCRGTIDETYSEVGIIEIGNCVK